MANIEAPPVKKPTPTEKPNADKTAAAKPEENVSGAPIDNFTASFLGKDKPPEKPADKKPEDKPKSEKPAPKSVKKTPTPERPLSKADVAEAAARGAAEGVRSVHPAPKPEEKPAEEKSKLPKEEQETVSVLQRMEKSNPEKYKGKAEQYEKAYAAALAYADDWKAKHPGKDFDEDDEEHKEFFEKNEEGLDWEDNDYTHALADIISDEKLAKANKHTDERVGQLEQVERLRAAEPVINDIKLKSARSFLGQMGERYKNLINADGTENAEIRSGLDAADPVETNIVITSADLTERLISENYKLFNNLVPFDGRNELHARIDAFIQQQEAQLLKLPKEDQLDAKGRQFMEASQYWKLPKEKRADYWTLGQPEVEVLLVNKMLKTAKNQIDVENKKFNARAKARGINLEEKKPVEKPKTEKPAAEKPADEKPADEKPESPNIPIQPRSAGGGASAADNPQERFTKAFLGKTS